MANREKVAIDPLGISALSAQHYSVPVPTIQSNNNPQGILSVEHLIENFLSKMK